LQLLELQGSVKPIDKSSTLESYNGESLGSLTGSSLVIGNRALDGKSETVKKPIIVMRKTDQNTLEIVGVIRNKLLFNSRPKIQF
jgi:hypothetical protein